MAQRVFYSFHYKPDASRASQVRNIGAVEGNQPASDNDWETVTGGGDARRYAFESAPLILIENLHVTQNIR